MEVAPSFSRVLKDCTVIEGQDFVLQCSVQGTPVPQITWLLNGEFPLLQPPGPSGLACILTWLAPFITQNHTGSRELVESAVAGLGTLGKLPFLSEPGAPATHA